MLNIRSSKKTVPREAISISIRLPLKERSPLVVLYVLSDNPTKKEKEKLSIYFDEEKLKI